MATGALTPQRGGQEVPTRAQGESKRVIGKGEDGYHLWAEVQKQHRRLAYSTNFPLINFSPEIVAIQKMEEYDRGVN